MNLPHYKIWLKPANKPNDPECWAVAANKKTADRICSVLNTVLNAGKFYNTFENEAERVYVAEFSGLEFTKRAWLEFICIVEFHIPKAIITPDDLARAETMFNQYVELNFLKQKEQK